MKPTVYRKNWLYHINCTSVKIQNIKVWRTRIEPHSIKSIQDKSWRSVSRTWKYPLPLIQYPDRRVVNHGLMTWNFSWICTNIIFITDTHIPMCKCPVKWETQKSPRKYLFSCVITPEMKQQHFMEWCVRHCLMMRHMKTTNSMARNSSETSLHTTDIVFIKNVYLLLSFLKKVVIKITAPQITPNTT